MASCYHCGDNILGKAILHQGHSFCCHGCVSVFTLLDAQGMCTFYDEPKSQPLSKAPKTEKYAFLEEVQNTLPFIQFASEEYNIVSFRSPHIQCASCVYLLEKLPQLQSGILQSQVNFSQQTITLHYQPHQISFRSLVEWLTTIGYEPILDPETSSSEQWKNQKKQHLIAIGVAGFCFANIMLLSFPEYLDLDMTDAPNMTLLFRYLNLFLSLPALFWGARSFFIKTIQGLRLRTLPIDAPLVLSLLITFGRSVYEVISGYGGGYFDSMTGIIFFMQLGKYFQEATQHRLHFGRTYQSFFPISCQVVKENNTQWKMLAQLERGDTVIVHGYEMIPCDSILISDHALIDYSFVTGESKPTAVSQGQGLYAGGKLLGPSIQIEINAPVSQSYLTSLWNHQKKTSEKTPTLTWVDQWAQHFTWFLLLLSVISGLYWWTLDPYRAMHAMSTILIVACPCALLLSATFTQGAVLMHLYQVGCYVKNNRVLHQLAQIDHLAWDKTGTLTSKEAQATWVKPAPPSHYPNIVALCSQSVHPLSQSVVRALRHEVDDLPSLEHFREHIGLGIEGMVKGLHYQIGSAAFTSHPDRTSSVVINANGECIGTFSMTHPIRLHMAETLHTLAADYSLSVISGDPLPTSPEIRAMIPEECPVFHGLSPQEKKQHIMQLTEHHAAVAMIGDGLNDAGALESAAVGIAITEQSHPFSPACDVMLEAASLPLLPAILAYAKRHEQIVQWSFGISLLYNLIGLGYAVNGTLHPLIAAVLMPISSITIMLFTTGLAYYFRPQNAEKILVS